MEVIKELGFAPKQIIATNGGAKSRFWCQIAADVLNRDIIAYPAHPGSALGVAFLAAKAAGVFENWSDIRLFLTESRHFTPDPEAVKVYDKAYRIYRELYTSLLPLNAELGSLYE